MALFGAAATPVVVALGVALWAPAAGLDTRAPLAQLGAFRPQIAFAAFVTGVCAVLVPWRPARIAGLACALVAASTVPQIAPRVVADLAAGPADLTVLSVNVFLSQADPAAVARLAVDRDADVVALPEGSAEYAAEVVRLAAGDGATYLSRTAGPEVPAGDGGPFPTSLLVRADRAPRFVPGPPLRYGTVSALIGPLTVTAVHPTAPVPGAEQDWRDDHAPLAALCARGGPLLLVGDFNSTLDQSPMRAVLAAGCRDAGEIAGRGLAGTWPAGSARPIRVPIDHVLLTPDAGEVTGYALVDVPHTDHRGLLVTIRMR
ncbi:MAG: endonuclease/exonuclease/phosphatase family protein [Pseudonocardia sp.]